MMMKQLSPLHILNGDASLPAFKAAKLPGQVLVWREILSEGPAVANIPEEAFWLRRQTYIYNTYRETAASYQQKVLDELPKLDAAGSFFEIVLWFDADLMCQINLLYLLHRLYQLQPPMVSVCIPPLHENIALLQPKAIEQLFEGRQQQNSLQLKQAHELWQLYAGPDPLELQNYLQQHQTMPPQLRNALVLHLSRFPGCRNGLSLPEEALVRLIQTGATTKEQLMQQFLQQHPGFGFGDWQLLHILGQFKPALVLDTVPYKLTPHGIQVLNGDSSYSSKEHWLGGYQIGTSNKLCYNSITQHLEISS
ncbi:DUF1835 domain-containing protein [Pontibacter toksunensis]|uniref:DUF1835 domain-containing protein n=1 Tax=Pontibacter toksunensis TaxID=1332631 RepID=A0ABW6BNQ3_9BACT